MLTTVTLLPLILNRPPSPWILRSFIAETSLDIAETTDMGQQGDEELVPEGEYDIFHQAVQSYLGRFHSSGDNAEYFLEDIGSLIPTDEALKDKITWYMQSSLKASLTHCAKIAQGVLTADKIIDTPLCAPPTAQKNEYEFFTQSNVLGKEHYRLNVDKSSEYQPTPPELASSMGLKAKVSQYTILVQNMLQTEQLMRRVAIYGSITDSWVASILKHIPQEARDKVVQEQVRIMNKSSQKAIASATAVASKFHLIHRDVALEQLQLQDEHIIRGRAAPFHGHSLVGPEPQEFDEKIMRSTCSTQGSH